MSPGSRAALELQRLVSFALLFIFGPVILALAYWRWDYRAIDVRTARRRFAQIRADHPGPMLICTNHLTLIDSIVQAVLLVPLTHYLTHVSALPWNLPEFKNFNHSLAWRLTCYLGRCIPVTRGGTKEQRALAQDRMRYVLERGDTISIFPEGTRSRSGRINPDDVSYASGQLLRLFPEATVVCVYLRGTRPGGFAHFPARSERFYIDLAVIKPASDAKGLRQARDFSRQIIGQLVEMEQRYFEDHPDAR